MYSNNQKISSFYPTSKKTSNTYNSANSSRIKNTILSNQNPNINIQSNQPTNTTINFVEKNISDSTQLALLTVNLTWQRLKSMELFELENYIKTLAYNNSFDSKKYLLALNILTQELILIKNQITNFLPIQKDSAPKNNNQETNKKINMNEILCIEPDEFNLDINLSKTKFHFDQSNQLNQSTQSNQLNQFNQQFDNMTNSNNSRKSNFNMNRSLDMGSLTGNPFGSVKINNHTANNPMVNNPKNTENFNMDNYSMNSYSVHDLHSNFYTNSDNFSSNSIIRQTSPIAKTNNFSMNRRSSNLSVGNSNNYLIIK